jgi:selenocysteine-specific elongation factor
VRLGVRPADVTEIIAAAGKGVLLSGDVLVARASVAAEAERLAEVVAAHHQAHPLDRGMSLQTLRAALGAAPAAVADQVLDLGVRKKLIEVEGGDVRRPGWKAAVDPAARALLAARVAAAGWQVPTLAELQREFATEPVGPLLAHLARDGAVEQMDQERYADPQALVRFREALEAALKELGQATPAELKDRFGLTRKHLIPLLEWSDRRGITRRNGDARVLARLTAPSGGP